MGKHYVYILTNQHRTTFYIGMTNNLYRRLREHIDKVNKGFTQRYNINVLLYFELFESRSEAIKREKQIKKFRREKKLDLVKTQNPKMISLNKWFE